MIEEMIKAVIGITVILCGWLLVQVVWRRVFPETPADEDVLAGRLGCHGCSRPSPCKMQDCSNEISTFNKQESSGG